MKATRTALFAVAAFAVTALAFSSAIRFNFTAYDDIDYVIGNHHISNGLTKETVLWALKDVGYASNWHPLAWISHAADLSITKSLGLSYAFEDPDDKRLWAGFKTGYAKISHLHNVLLHAANAALLFFLLTLLTRQFDDGSEGSYWQLAIPFSLALFWSLHPLRAEVVCWVSERKELLSVFFALLTLILYVAARGKNAHSTPLYLLALASFALALMSKPVAVGLPAILVAWEIAFRKTETSSSRPMALFRSALPSFPFAFLALATCALTLSAQTEALDTGKTVPPLYRAIGALTAPAYYLKQTVWPFGLSINYPFPSLENWGYLSAGIGIILIILGIVVWWLVRNDRVGAFGIFAISWLYVGLLPMLGIVKVGSEPHSDRYTYWVGCGLSACLSLLAAHASRILRPYSKQVYYSAAAILALLAVITAARSSVWRNTELLFADAVEKNHDDEYAYLLALELSQKHTEKDSAKAEEMLRDVLAINHSPNAEGNLAFILSIRQKADENFTRLNAEIEFLCASALAADPKCKTALAALAIKDYRTHNYCRALERIEKAFACGYEAHVVKIDLDEWKANAAKEATSCTKD